MKATRYMLGLAGLAVLAGAVFMLSADEQAPAPVAQAPAPQAPPPPEPAAAPAQAPAPQAPSLLAKPEPVLGEEGEHGEFTTTTDVVKQKILKNEPQLALFDYFRQHVLLDSNGRKDYEALLADTQMYEKMRSALLHPTEDKESFEYNVKRLMQIDYLREALGWKQNPARQQLMSEVERILLEDSFTATMAPGIKRSLSATKTELYELLYDQDPERARALVEAAKGTRLEGMLDYIAQRNLRRLKKEQELSVQYQARQSQGP